MNIESPLFTNAFDISIWKNDSKIIELLSNLEQIERTIEGYLGQIKDDFPWLTDHSINHSRKLWDYAQIIVGENKISLNPIEAFVLHIVFLIHDAGMCYSILNNKKEIEKDPLYTDYLARNGNNNEAIEDALFFTVRERHGDFVLKIANDPLASGEFLISNVKIREELGIIIGKIAKSHTCPTSYIERELNNYSSPNYPPYWCLDCKKVAFLLRTSDAAHIDNLRSPKTNRLIAEIPGDSRHHWSFQKKLGFPTLKIDGLLVYHTNTPFKKEEQKAWWVCYSALKVLDKELKDANEYFQTNFLPGFSAIGVKSINDPFELGKKYILTDGWDSIDTQVKVSNPIKLASDLGGINLYGKTSIAIRELIQNSLDAINLYTYFTERKDENPGIIKVTLNSDNNDFYLTITDNGIGMNDKIMTNNLLEFGGSYWKSQAFNYDFQGLYTKGFESIGKFGIGFFSTFMLGDFVTVTSWKYGEDISKMKTLDFYNGLMSNPILRDPTEQERSSIHDRGTSVKIKLKEYPFSPTGFIGNNQFLDNNLFSIVKYFIPSPNTKIVVKEIDESTKEILPNSIEKLKFPEFIDHVYTHLNKLDRTADIDFLKKMNIELIDINDRSKSFGKLAILPEVGFGLASTALVISNGIRINEIHSFVGYIDSKDIVTIKRDSYTKLITYEAMKSWALKQRKAIELSIYKRFYIHKYQGLLMTFNLFNENLIITKTKKNNQYFYISISKFRDYLKVNDEVEFFEEGHVLSARLESCEGFINLNYGFNVKDIIRDEDLHKLIEHKGLIEKIIKEEWGGFNHSQENLFLQQEYDLGRPYLIIEKYIRNFRIAST